MAWILKESIEEIKAKADIVDLVSRYVNLKKSGGDFIGLSPFSSEKTPSFHVNESKGFYYCFSTSQGGDVIDFVQKLENLSFNEAAEFLARLYGVEIKYKNSGESFEEKSLRKQIFEILEKAAFFYNEKFFEENLNQAQSMRDYWLSQRKFSLESAKDFQIGYAPNDQSNFLKELLSKGFSKEAIVASSLFNKNLSPFFQGRLIVPIKDAQNRVISFTARKTQFTPDNQYESGKYKNGKDSPVFSKKLTLFNLSNARSFAKDTDELILVEGQLDAIRLSQNNIKNVIASQGTALTIEQTNLIRRYAKCLICFLDADSAGMNSAWKALGLAFKSELAIKYIILPDGKDPDEFFLENKNISSINELKDFQLSPMAFAHKYLFKNNAEPLSAYQKADKLNEIYQVLSSCKSSFLINEYLEELAILTNSNITALIKDFNKIKKSIDFNKNYTNISNISQKNENFDSQMLTNAQYDALILCLHNEDLAENFAKALLQLRGESMIDQSKIYGKLLMRLSHLLVEDFCTLKQAIENLATDENEKNILSKLLVKQVEQENIKDTANQCLKRIYDNFCNNKIAQIQSLLSNTKDQSVQLNLLKQVKDINKLRATCPTII